MVDEIPFPLRGSAYPLPGRCGGLLAKWKARYGEKRYCTRPAGWGTVHSGKGCCKLHFGRSQSHVQKWERERLAGEVKEMLMKFSERLGSGPLIGDPNIELIKLVSEIMEMRKFLLEKVDEIESSLTVMDRAGVERSRALLDKLMEITTLSKDSLKDLAKLDIMRRKVEIDEDQAHFFAGIVLAVLTSPQIGLTDEALESAREILAERLSTGIVSKMLRPRDLVALDNVDDLNDIIDAEEIE